MASKKYKELERVIEVVVRSIPKEKEAQELYRSTAASVDDEMIKRLFDMMADQEGQHEKKLKAVLQLLQQEQAKLKE